VVLLLLLNGLLPATESIPLERRLRWTTVVANTRRHRQDEGPGHITGPLEGAKRLKLAPAFRVGSCISVGNFAICVVFHIMALLGQVPFLWWVPVVAVVCGSLPLVFLVGQRWPFPIRFGKGYEILLGVLWVYPMAWWFLSARTDTDKIIVATGFTLFWSMGLALSYASLAKQRGCNEDVESHLSL